MSTFNNTDNEAGVGLLEKCCHVEVEELESRHAHVRPAHRGSTVSGYLHSQCATLAVAFLVGILCTTLVFQAWSLKISGGRQSRLEDQELSLLGTSLGSFRAERNEITSESLTDTTPAPPGTLKVSIEYDDRYPGPPTPESEQLWLDLLPDGLGFVQHDALDPGIVDLAVFHQLHCLMALRHALYDAWNETQHSHMTPHHVRHCLEYLRQGIMCAADTNTERRISFEDGSKATLGWEEKRCRDYGAIKEWAERYRVWNGKLPGSREEVEDPGVVDGRVIHY